MTGPLLAIAAVTLATVVIGFVGVRVSRTTSDFLVASRGVRPLWNASAIGGEYLSAASFLGIAGLVMAYGVDMLWYPVGYTVGYLVLLLLVAAPLRRSGAYTVPDFAEGRMESLAVRRVAAVLVVLIGWLYLLPQFQGAGLTLHILVGSPEWVGGAVVAVVVAVTVLAGGMRSITFVQAFQYWLKLTAIALPALLVVSAWRRDGFPSFVEPGWGEPLSGFGSRPYPVYATLSLVLATFLGTMGLPHVLVRFYTSPDGRAARRTALLVLVLLSVFYLFPPVIGAMGRVYAPDLIDQGRADAVVLLLPSAALPGGLGGALTALVSAGAFAAFLSTASGLAVSVAGVLSQDVLRPRRRARGPDRGVRRFRAATTVAVGVPFALALAAGRVNLAETVAMAFAVSASALCPLLVLGIWWRGLSVPGALASMAVGGTVALASVGATLVAGPFAGPAGVALAAPAAWSVPLSFAVAVVVSALTPGRRPTGTARTMLRLHTPEDLDVRPG